MSNVLHKNFTLDNNHALHAREYADNAARDADTAFNGDSANIGKVVFVTSPASVFSLVSIAPLFLEFSNTTAGNVTTLDDLLATQLLLGNGGTDIVTEPDITYDGFQLQTATINITSQLEVGEQTGSTTTLDNELNLAEFGGVLIDDTDVIATVGGDIVLKNIDVVDNVTRDAIEAVIIDLPNLASVGFTSGSIIGPSGAWTNDGFNVGPGDKYSINSVIVLDGDTVITLKNIEALDAITEATIEAAIDTLANLTSVQGLAVAYADAGEDAIWGWDDGGSTYRNLTPAEAIAAIGAVTTSDVLGNNQLLTGNGGVDIVTEPLLVWTGTLLGVGTVVPDTTVDVDGNGLDALRLRSGNTSGFTRNQIRLSHDDGVNFTHLIKTRHNEFDQSSNAIDFFMWDPDDQSPGDLGNFPVFTLRGDGKIGANRTTPVAIFDILSLFGDSNAILALESTSNAGHVNFRVGNRNPDGAVNGNAPDLYFHDAGTLSGIFENRGSGFTNAWLKHSALSPTVIEIHNSDELDALASGGVITVASDLTLRIMGTVATANRFVVDQGVFFIISGEYIADSILLYTGPDTFITSSGNAQIRANASIIATSTGTLLNCTAGSITNIEQSQIAGWDDLGIVNDARAFFLTLVTFQSISAGLTFNNVTFLNINAAIQVNDGIGEPFFRINTNDPQSASTINDMDSRNSTVGASLLDIDTRIHPLSTVTVTNSVVAFGDLFRQSVLTDATINSVADGSPATGTITAMADNGSGGTTISSTTTYFESELVTISGTTSYNNNGELLRIFNVVAGVSFDIITEFVADDATGSVDSTRLTLSLAGGHGISISDSIKIIDTNFYNGFKTTLNVVSDDITVNGVFISTNTGSIERDLSLDQTDPRVSVRNNPGFVNSHFIACVHVNDNDQAVGAIVNNTFTDMVFGTAGDALIASSTMERWRLVDEINGTFEYFGQELFDDAIQFDFTVESAGGTVDFRFKWQIDNGSGFVDLPDNVEALVAVGSDAQSVTKKFPLVAVNGDLIKPQITRNSGSSGITTTYATIFAGG